MIGYAPLVTGERLDEMWARMMSLFVERRDVMLHLLAEHDLTPPHAHALGMLRDGPQRMRDLADLMACDASYITAVVDRLEERGLAERRASPADRRAKEIALTPAGARLAAEIGDTIRKVPAAFSRLSREERSTLAGLLAKAVPEPAGDPFTPPRP